MRTMILWAALLPLAGLAGEAVLCMGGALKLETPGIQLQGCLYTADWKKSVSGSGTSGPDEKGGCAFKLVASDKETVTGRADVTAAENGALRAVYTLTPR